MTYNRLPAKFAFFKFFAFVFLLVPVLFASAQTERTYAEKLGYPKGAKVLILHVDDAGMSFDSNDGTITALTKGVANSCSVMMPCSWVPGFLQFLKEHPSVDAGLHLTLTSEWSAYRWGPVSGKSLVKGLTDPQGALWHSVQEVVQHASADEVDLEIHNQYDKAITMGFNPTHFDSHMGTLFGSPAYLERYVKLGIEKQIPVMMPGGHDQLISQQMKMPEAQLKQLQQLGTMLWGAGLPVLDDLHNVSYDWKIPPAMVNNDRAMQAFKTNLYIKALKELKPGVTMMIMHCTNPSPVFKEISGSGPTRKGDMLAMLDPAFKKALQDQGIILTTWRELKQRRDSIH